jgi:hypothetical protein
LSAFGFLLEEEFVVVQTAHSVAGEVTAVFGVVLPVLDPECPSIVAEALSFVQADLSERDNKERING